MIGSSSDIDISIAAVVRAWREFRRGKRASREIIAFEYHLEEELWHLASDLASGRYRHGPYQMFEVHDSKRRQIAVASVRDRVVHRLLYMYLVDVYDATFAYHAWSCRAGKGLNGAVEAARRNMWRYRDGWLWCTDVRKFFDSVDHVVLESLLRRRLGEHPHAMRLVRGIIDSYCTDDGTKGMAIGNLTSQIFANIYLNEVDRYVLHSVRPLGYVRYGDDMVLWLADKPSAVNASDTVRAFLEQDISLSINLGTTTLQPARRRLAYLGVELWPTGCRLDRRMHQRLQTKLTYQNYASYDALVTTYDTRRRQDMLRYAMFR